MQISVTLFLRRGPVHPPLPFKESPLSHTPSVKFFLTTFFTSSNAWGSRGVLKHVRCETRDKNIEGGPVPNATLNQLQTLSAMTVISLPGRSWAHYRWGSHHCLSLTLWRFESGLWHKVTSSGNQRGKPKLASKKWICNPKVTQDSEAQTEKWDKRRNNKLWWITKTVTQNS